jgi:hypothetical protein
MGEVDEEENADGTLLKDESAFDSWRLTEAHRLC